MSAATCSQCGSTNLKNMPMADGRQQVYCQKCSAYKILETSEASRQGQHLKNLYDAKFERLCVLELQAAQYGINVRPEVITEINSIKTELRQLENQIQMLDPHITSLGQTSLRSNHVVLPISPMGTQRIEIRIKGELDIHDQIPPSLLSAAIRAFAAVLDIGEEQIAIVNVRHGSIILTVDLPKEAVEKLLTLYEAGDKIIHDLGILEIQPDQDETIIQDFVFLGAPGAGKSTQAKFLEEQTGLVRVASGDLFRAALRQGTELGMLAKSYMDRGELVPDEVAIRMIVERIRQPDCANGVIFDGFPRTREQGQALEHELREHSRRIDYVLFLRVPEDVLLRRLAGRQTCKTCGSNYNIYYFPSKRADVCDDCGGKLYQRSDDTLETARYRLQVYFAQTMPLIEYYRETGRLLEINGQRELLEIRDLIRAHTKNSSPLKYNVTNPQSTSRLNKK
jgi:adenylate kinase